VYLNTKIRLRTFIEYNSEEPMYSDIYIGICKNDDTNVFTSDPYTTICYDINGILATKNTIQQENAIEYLCAYLKYENNDRGVYCISSICLNG